MFKPPMSQHDAQRTLSEIESAVLVDGAIGLFHQRLLAVTRGLILVRRIGVVPTTFRSRKNINATEFSQVEQLWHPKPEQALQNRLNKSGQPLLYCSDNSAVAIMEQRPQRDDLITILECAPSGQVGRFVLIGDLSNQVDHRQSMLPDAKGIDVGPLIRQFGAETIEYSATIDRVFSRWLSQPDKRYYCLTNWLAEFLFAMNDLDAIIYPTVVWTEGFNMALRPDSAVRLLQPRQAFSLRIDKPSAKEKGQSPGYYSMVSDSISKDGSIQWKVSDGHLV